MSGLTGQQAERDGRVGMFVATKRSILGINIQVATHDEQQQPKKWP